ncbi:MAG: hypothetical protein C0498_01300 [Anaerolinea sp.]|nr:hypothetical protein [Anaerolinea sp.]
MAATIAYGPTTITLRPESPSKVEVASQVERETLGGYRRLGLLWRKYRYSLTLEPLAPAEYDAIRDLWVSARAGGSWLTFAWADWWAETAGGVLVSAELGSQDNAYADLVRTTLVLTEVNPR